jgi:putative ABC transport system substrate-binding protein
VAERVSELASDLMGLQVKLIVAQGAAVPMLRKLALPVPIIYAFSGDPVAAGFANSLARPHRNMTGVTLMAAELSGKRLELLKELTPDLRRVAVLARPEHPGEPRERAYCKEAADKLGLAIAFFPTSKPQEIDAAFAAMAADPPQGILVLPDGFMVQNRHRLLEGSAIQRVPLVSGWRIFAESGAVCTYGPTLTESYRRLAYFVDRVLKGAEPSDLPIEQPTRFELVVNLKTAHALGLTVPRLLLAQADEVIE